MFIPSHVTESSREILPWIWLYIGPDVFLPITSALAAIAGVALMFWHRIVGIVRKIWLMVTGRSR